MGTMKGFKVTDAERKVRVGIAARNLEELKTKAVEKFKLKLSPDQISLQTSDGTVVESDEYFQTLDAQILLIWVKSGEKAETDEGFFYRTIREVNEQYLTAGEKVQEFFSEKLKSKVFKLAELLKGIDTSKTAVSHKKDHSEWFEGIDSRSKTKEEYMFRRAQDRIRTYYYKTKDELTKRAEVPAEHLRFLLGKLQNDLHEANYNGCYFDRSCAVGDVKLQSICDENGTFTCQGRWDKPACLYKSLHQINPYSSREERIIFQTWNLDHGIERTREITPAIVQALIELDKSRNGRTKRKLDTKRIFDDLFTINNLRLVHIVCHDKAAHTTKIAGPYLI